MTVNDIEALPAGTVVTAKALGWDERLADEDYLDSDPFQDDDQYPRPSDLSGPVTVVRATMPGNAPLVVVLVGGREADPATVTPGGDE